MKEIFTDDSITSERLVYSVSQLNQEVRYLLEGNFSSLWIEGEISNLREPGSGHLYFTLKDARAQVRCALFRGRANRLNFQLKDGMQVLTHAVISLYEERGDFQLIVESIEQAGDGLLRKAFEALKKRLSEEGLFALAHKKQLPRLPRSIGVITSSTGAAIRDILTVLKRRFPAIPVIIYPSLVQGNDAARQIAAAITLANQRQECDVLIIARGGGSLEDLWPFNEEIVARAIYHSIIPTVSAIGHEIDVTIADFVADQRAPTPSAAAELVVPDMAEWLTALQRLQVRLAHVMQVFLNHAGLLVENLARRLPHPQRRLQDQAQRLDGLEQRLILAHQHLLRHKQAELTQVYTQMQRNTPLLQLSRFSLQSGSLQQRLQMAMTHLLNQHGQQLNALMRALDGVSPLNTLNRGYAIAMKDEKILRNAQEVVIDEAITVRLAKGSLQCQVGKVLDS